MARRDHLAGVLLALLAVSPALGGVPGQEAVESECLEHCGQATLLLRDGRILRGAIQRSARDSVWVRTVQPGVSPVAGEEAVTLLLWQEVDSVRCGDSLKNGAFNGFLAGSAVGGTLLTLLAFALDDSPGGAAIWDLALGIGMGVLVVGIPSAVGGALIDAYHGGRLRRYLPADCRPTSEAQPILTAPGRSGLGALFGGAYAGVLFPGDDGHAVDALALFGVRATYLGRKGIFSEFSFGLTQNNKEAWGLLNANVGVTAGRDRRFAPYAVVGFNASQVRYYEKPGVQIRFSQDEQVYHLAWGGGAFINALGGKLAVRPEFKWSIGSEGFTDASVGASYRF